MAEPGFKPGASLGVPDPVHLSGQVLGAAARENKGKSSGPLIAENRCYLIQEGCKKVTKPSQQNRNPLFYRLLQML